jgi:hypothetical protein
VDTQSQALEEGSKADESMTSDCQTNATAWAGGNPVNIRCSVPFFGRRFYLTVVAGQERRPAERLKADRSKHPLATRANIIFLSLCGVVAGLAVIAIFQMLSVSLLQEIGIVVSGQ